MKAANLAFRPAIVVSLIAGLTVLTGLLPVSSTAQDTQRTIATGSNIPLTADAPNEYTVKTGDTLWDISKVFLRDPWYWPEIWYVNPQVENPHLLSLGGRRMPRPAFLAEVARLTALDAATGPWTARVGVFRASALTAVSAD